MVQTELPVKRNVEGYENWVPHSLHQQKLNNAVKHGAIGMLYVNHIANPNTCYNKGFVYAHIGTNAAQDAFFNTGKDFDKLISKIKQTLKPQSFSTGNKGTISANSVHYPGTKGCNAILYACSGTYH